ncbi:DNA replication/repair protein RecF [Methylococcus capsulatus]|uniref:DNA replication/repair protein RecF n=1 Tax=Methylococcus capsulatus TaxID=414 RepID=UPI001C52DC4E|nr:DNA replication/repair protein RecF [Methylococcus capsulatus]QXP86575.1 DNA replication/repair protein RecF [Methylococcus capsulatus]QXP93747.1 DNA replication/repair protein RecF [Methylococcus capsulatus]UQN11532.1 DNA replication/repair protein RecF [Methylococcus capsulatus]
MALLKLDIADVRNIESASLSPGEGLNLLFGANGSGKTSLLEAIYLLSRGKSFRSPQSGRIIRFDRPCLTVSGSIGRPGAGIAVGVRLGRSEKEVRVGGRSCDSSAQLIRLFPAVLIHPASVALLEGPPRWRRQMLDWGVFHVEQGYLDLLRRFSRTLEQRNAVLRGEAPGSSLAAWSGELARWGTMIAELRSSYLDRIRMHFGEMVSALLGRTDVELVVRPGWRAGWSYADALAASQPTDRRLGYTEPGPQKGDFAVLVGGRPARDYLSRGQLKLLTYALLLAQAGLLEADQPGRVCLLVDDIASELDSRNQERLLSLVKSTGLQSFVTFSGATQGVAAVVGRTARVFHVEQGRIRTGS